MNIFQQLWEFVRDRLNSASYDELDAVFIPSDEVLNDWIATLSESDKQQLSETAREIHHAGRDYMQFLAITYYLHQTRFEPFATLLDIARRKAAPLLVRFEGITDNEWTEAELDRWLDSLDEFSRDSIQERVRSYVSRGGSDLITLLCTLRRNLEAQQREQASRNRISLLHMWYIWDEEHRKVQQLEAAKELRQYIREQRGK